MGTLRLLLPLCLLMISCERVPPKTIPSLATIREQMYTTMAPISIQRDSGITFYDYDTKIVHRSKKHYERLIQIVRKEFNIRTPDSLHILVIFMSEDLKVQIQKHNPDWLQLGSWVSVYIGHETIIMSEEADDNFMHELLHLYHDKGILFKEFTPEQAHPVVYLNEQFLLVSRSYLDYMEELQKEKHE